MTHPLFKPNLCAVLSGTVTLWPAASAVFEWASKFNQDLGGWNTGKVEDMRNSQYAASVFRLFVPTPPLSSPTHCARLTLEHVRVCNTLSLAASAVFMGASKFNQDLGAWKTTNVTRMAGSQ